MRVTRHLYDVPGWGVGEVWARDGVIVQHELASEELRVSAVAAGERGERGEGPADGLPTVSSPNGGAGLPARTLAVKPRRDRADIVPALCRRFAEHLGGSPTAYDDVPIDLYWETELQLALARAARSIPWGEVVSYGELADLAGRPRAARAAGAFCAENRYSLIIPCHRIVAAGGIGGYGSAGPALKRRLLALEGVHL